MNNNNTARNWEKDTTPYPEPFVEVIDESFNRYILGNAGMERLHTGCRWTEGPASVSYTHLTLPTILLV